MNFWEGLTKKLQTLNATDWNSLDEFIEGEKLHPPQRDSLGRCRARFQALVGTVVGEKFSFFLSQPEETLFQAGLPLLPVKSQEFSKNHRPFFKKLGQIQKFPENFSHQEIQWEFLNLEKKPSLMTRIYREDRQGFKVRFAPRQAFTVIEGMIEKMEELALLQPGFFNHSEIEPLTKELGKRLSNLHKNSKS